MSTEPGPGPNPGDSRLVSSAETVIGIDPLTGLPAPPARTTSDARTSADPGMTASDTAATRAMPTPQHERPPELPGVQLERALGQGGMGAVYRGRQIALDRPVAVKVIHPRLATDKAFVDRFDREAKVLAKLSHPNIVACYEAGTATTGEKYLLMEFVEGEDLLKKVNRDGPLAERDALVIVRQVADGLDHALDAGVIHRDVKPENILLKNVAAKQASTAIGVQAKIVDLGLASMARADKEAVRITQAGTALGTPLTMAPEQAEAPDTIDHRADIYALGCTLYYALVGRFPHEGATIAQVLAKKLRDDTINPRRLRQDLSEEVAALTLRMMSFDASKRPASYDELLSLLDALIAKKPGPAPKATTQRIVAADKSADASVAPSGSPGGGGKGLLVGVVVLALAGGGAGFALFGPGAAVPPPANPPATPTVPPTVPATPPAPPVAPPPPPVATDLTEPPPVVWDTGERLFQRSTEREVIFDRWDLATANEWTSSEDFGEVQAMTLKEKPVATLALKAAPKSGFRLTTQVCLRWSPSPEKGKPPAMVKETGLRLIAGSTSVKVLIQNFTKEKTLYRVESSVPGAPTASADVVVDPKNVYRVADQDTGIVHDVDVDVVNDRLWVQLDKKRGKWISAPIAGPVTGLEIYVREGSVSFGEMLLSMPRP